jgi:hypothetical protein
VKLVVSGCTSAYDCAMRVTGRLALCRNAYMITARTGDDSAETRPQRPRTHDDNEAGCEANGVLERVAELVVALALASLPASGDA